jgi:hypothetical protein
MDAGGRVHRRASARAVLIQSAGRPLALTFEPDDTEHVGAWTSFSMHF